uniref:mitogen-activated protein kinase kinase kinase n=1 Tax=Oryza barthii TaxID=65489 RepID=A0A0D3F6D8_9ORYZ
MVPKAAYVIIPSRRHRYTDPVVHTSGRTVLPDGHNGMVEEKRFVSCGILQEHQKFFEVPIANVNEVHHMQIFEPSTSESSYSRGRMLPEDTFAVRPRSHSPGPRGHAYSACCARDFGFTPRSPVKRMDDPRSPSQPLPLPPVPVASSSIPSSSITSSQFQSQWKRGKLLGSGTFGQVYLGFNSENGQFCAIKEVQVFLDDSHSKERLRQLNQEIDMLKQLSHQNIVQYYGSELADEALSIYLEYVSGGSIHKLLREYGPFKEPVIRNYTRQILSGLAYLHGRNTVHRDIKGANILVGPNGEVKLADFGMAKHVTSFAEIRSFRGSPYWMAPEVVMNNKGYNLAVDIWSLGCTIIEMATAKHPWYPYEDVAAIFKIANSKDIPEIPDCFSKEGKDFLSLCLKRDPVQRPSAALLLGHPFVQDHQAVRAPTCNGTQLRNGISSPAGASHRKRILVKEKHCSSAWYRRTKRKGIRWIFHSLSFSSQYLQQPNCSESQHVSTGVAMLKPAAAVQAIKLELPPFTNASSALPWIISSSLPKQSLAEPVEAKRRSSRSLAGVEPAETSKPIWLSKEILGL